MNFITDMCSRNPIEPIGRALLAASVFSLTSPAFAGPVENFSIATCAFKRQLGNPPAIVAVTTMLQGILAINPQALNAWRVNTGGDTYWGNIEAGKNVNEFIDWISAADSSSVESILVPSVQRRCY